MVQRFSFFYVFSPSSSSSCTQTEGKKICYKMTEKIVKENDACVKIDSKNKQNKIKKKTI